MAKKQKSTVQLETVAHAESLRQAAEYEDLLKASGIPVVINEDYDEEQEIIAIMVPEQFFDEATAIIESEKGYDEYYLNDDEDSHLDSFMDDFSDEF